MPLRLSHNAEKRVTQPYEQGAIIANIEVAGGHNHHAFERFTQNGPMALLPMSNNRYSLVWCMRQEHIEHRRFPHVYAGPAPGAPTVIPPRRYAGGALAVAEAALHGRRNT